MGDNHMQQMLPEQPPTYTSQQPPYFPQSHNPSTLHLPSVPQHELPPIAPSQHEKSLPSLQSILAEAPPPRTSLDDVPMNQSWPSSNPYSTYYQPSYGSPRTRPVHSMDSPGTMDIDNATPDSRRGVSVLSIDDPDVRLAAEALGDLRAADYHTPPARKAVLPQNQPEPLLSLLTTSYPRSLGPIIDVSLSTYSASKNYSPVFRSSAEIVERGLTPVVNRAGTISRVTGVEGLVRWSLGGRRPPRHRQAPDVETGPSSKKRRKVRTEDDEMDIEEPYMGDMTPVYRPTYSPRERRPSNLSTVESLPAYDDHRSPSYTPNDQALVTTDPQSPSSTWQSRLILSTSGLSVAMSEESLRSLKYCLGWLRWANEHLGKAIEALRSVLMEYDSSLVPTALQNGETGESQMVVHSDHKTLQARIEGLKSDILKTLKNVVDIVSKYAGGALPENARILVRRHLTSLPQRFRMASTSTFGSKDNKGRHEGEEMKDGAKRVLVLAKEGLDMMGQICGVLDGTIVSAEEWCDRLGRRKRAEFEERNGEDAREAGRQEESDGDVKMERAW